MSSGQPFEDPPAILNDSSPFEDWFRWIPEKGFQWSIGTEGATGLPGRFLHAGSKTGKKHAETDQEAYLDFARAEGTESALLEFAGQHGCLGIPKEHFHTVVGFFEWGEPLSSWQHHHERFRTAFKLWEAVSDLDIPKLNDLMTLPPHDAEGRRQMIPEAGLCGADEQLFARDPFVAATKVVVHLANCGLKPPENVVGILCCVRGCTAWKFEEVFKKTTPWVEPTLEVREAGKAVNVVRHDKPRSLLAAIWLQFAELIARFRRIRRCDECGEYMDVTNCARPSAKRIHERCSHNARARRWRRKNKDND